MERAVLGLDAYLQLAEEHRELPNGLRMEEQRVLALWQELQDIASQWADHPDHPFPPEHHPDAGGPALPLAEIRQVSALTPKTPASDDEAAPPATTRGADALAGQRGPADAPNCAATCHHELHADGVLVYTLAGDLDLSAAAAVTLDSPLGAIRAVVVDLAAVTFFDSTGLNALLRLHAAAQERAVTVHLAAVPAQTARVLDITGAGPLFPTHPSREAALATVSRPHLPPVTARSASTPAREE
ncbi:STAS domain-containing protein [Streptacidiphilus pinicola]|uniref:STAS domain-containing protein n=1 Tax=Streptacidiphilus pinicola TaxID=2219663 RepID=UPI001FB4FDC8|nr:STAS domain-containing protein [Streptacidiphilus pinicola]